MKIQFTDVGRHKRNWIAEIDISKPDDDVHLNILMEIDRNGGLISRGIDAEYDHDYNGTVFAGFRAVGTFHEYDELNDRYGPAMRAGAEG